MPKCHLHRLWTSLGTRHRANWPFLAEERCFCPKPVHRHYFVSKSLGSFKILSWLFDGVSGPAEEILSCTHYRQFGRWNQNLWVRSWRELGRVEYFSSFPQSVCSSWFLATGHFFSLWQEGTKIKLMEAWFLKFHDKRLFKSFLKSFKGFFEYIKVKINLFKKFGDSEILKNGFWDQKISKK